MRTQTVRMGDKDIFIREMKIKDIKENLLPKLEPAWQAIVESETANMLDIVTGQVKDIVPELQGVDLDDCYPSEIEAFWEAWINVNFTGVKRLLELAPSLPMTGLLKSESD